MIFKNKLIAYIIIIVIITIIITVCLYQKNWSIDFEEITSYDINPTINLDESNIVWFSLRDKKYEGFYSNKMLDNYGIDSQNITFDYDQYTYIFTIGHKLNSIKYSYSLFKNRQFVFFPKQFIGEVNLDENLQNKVFVYKIMKMDIDCDYHSPKSHVTFS